MEIYVILFLLALVAAAVQFFSSTEIIFKKGTNQLTGKGIGLSIALLVQVFLPLIQNKLQENKQQRDDTIKEAQQAVKDKAQKNSYDSSLLSLKTQSDSSYSRTMQVITEKLGEYKLAYDSATGVIAKIIKDSGQGKTIETPVLGVLDGLGQKGISYVEKADGSKIFYVNLMSRNGAASFFKIDITTILSDWNENLRYTQKKKAFEYYDKIAPGESRRFLTGILSGFNYGYVVFWIRGTYSNMLNSQRYHIDDVVFYNMKSNSWAMMTGEIREFTIDFIKKMEKK